MLSLKLRVDHSFHFLDPQKRAMLWLAQCDNQVLDIQKVGALGCQSLQRELGTLLLQSLNFYLADELVPLRFSRS